MISANIAVGAWASHLGGLHPGSLDGQPVAIFLVALGTSALAMITHCWPLGPVFGTGTLPWAVAIVVVTAVAGTVLGLLVPLLPSITVAVATTLPLARSLHSDLTGRVGDQTRKRRMTALMTRVAKAETGSRPAEFVVAEFLQDRRCLAVGGDAVLEVTGRS
jgi:hypothetical protein